MAIPPWKVRPLAACKEARQYFSPDVAESMNYFDPEVDAPEHLGEYLEHKVIFSLRNRHGFGDRDFPVSVDDFLWVVEPAFSHPYRKEFKALCVRFDDMIIDDSPEAIYEAQGNRVSDSFMCCLSFRSWIAQICQAIALHCFRSLDTTSVRRAIPQFDGPSDTTPIQAGVVNDGGPFTQVTLTGPSLSTAWNRLQFTKQLEDACRTPSNWSPSQPGGMYVYHGTAAHIENPRFLANLALRPFQGLRGWCSINQMTQGTDRIPVVWTAFSPFRAFLWAVFGAEVIRNVPGPTGRSKLEASWQSGGKTYEGVLVIQFSSSQPSPPHCSSYVIPKGMEGQWHSIAAAGRGLPTSEPTQSLWGKFATIHQQPQGSEWPTVVHGLELESSRMSLQPFTKQFWRTIWSGNGIDTLNYRHEQSLAIRYILKPDTPPPLFEDTSMGRQDRDGKPGKGKMNSLRRHFSRMSPKNLFKT